MQTLTNHYKTLQIQPTATQAEIKQAYRRLAKIFHPDSQNKTANHEQIVHINAAYEILGDPQKRQSYDRQLSLTTEPNGRGTEPWVYKPQKTAAQADTELYDWINKIYKPINRIINQILKPFKSEVDQLAADPFDDELMENFQNYIERCKTSLEQAQKLFRSLPNPANVAGVAAHLYYTLNHLSDALDELEMFTMNYDDSYLHTGQEFFRIATRLRREVQEEMKKIS